MEVRRCGRQSRDARDALPEPRRRSNVASKDKNSKKSMEKKPAQKTLKEKRAAKKAKK